MEWTAKEIKKLRSLLGYTQAQMASAVGYSIKGYKNLEYCKYKPSKNCCKILAHLNDLLRV